MDSIAPPGSRRRELRSRRKQGGWWQFAIPAAIGALNLLSGKASAKAAEEGQRETNATNLQIARDQMEFQERMSGTSYQRGVKDMMAAGLNPMLAYQQGGAAAPAGATTRVDNPKSQAASIMQNAVGSSASQALQLYGAYQQAELAQAQTQNTQAQTVQTIRQTLSPEIYQQQGYANLYRTHEEQNRLATGAKKDEQETLNLFEEIAGIKARSAAEQERFQEAKNRGGFAADVEKRKADSRAAQYGLSEAKSTSDFFNNAGQLPKWLQLILQTMRASSGFHR